MYTNTVISLQLPAALHVICVNKWLQATRWTNNAECLGRILSKLNYEVLFTIWEELLQYVKEKDMKSLNNRRKSMYACMESIDFFFGV